MGNTFTITAWGKHDGYNYSESVVWAGESALKAIAAFIKAKRTGYGCVKFEWR